MTARARVALVVAVAALGAAVAVVAITEATSEDAPGAAAAGPQARSGAPPLSLDLGVRADAEAADLREALRLYDAGHRAAAAKLFARHSSLEARIGESFSRWPDGTVARLTQLSGLHPEERRRSAQPRRSPASGPARTARRTPGSRRRASSPTRRTPSRPGISSIPEFARNLPVFVPSVEAPSCDPQARGPGSARAAACASTVGHGTDRLYYGVALQRLGKQRSAERVYAEAARRAPQDAEARVAAAVGLFDKAEPARAFSRLGPLTRTFPKAATVRFHLGLLLLWSGEVKQARRQLELVRTLQPGSPLAAAATGIPERVTQGGCLDGAAIF